MRAARGGGGSAVSPVRAEEDPDVPFLLDDCDSDSDCRDPGMRRKRRCRGRRCAVAGFAGAGAVLILAEVTSSQ